MTGAVASKKVTEAYKGSLRLVGNQSQSAKAEGSYCEKYSSSRVETRS